MHTLRRAGESNGKTLTGNQRAGNNLQHPYLGLGCAAEVSLEGHDRRRTLPLPSYFSPPASRDEGKERSQVVTWDECLRCKLCFFFGRKS